MASLSQKIIPCIWFNDNASEAVKLYTSLFKNSKINRTSYYTESGKEIHKHNAGDVLTIDFEIEGQKFTALNGGPMFPLSEAVSFQVMCKDQKEVDFFWDKLTANGGQESVCGWLKDTFGLSWQIVPEIMADLLDSPDKEKSERAMAAMMGMKKLDIAALQKAYDGK